jgi:hypothetical protein
MPNPLQLSIESQRISDNALKQPERSHRLGIEGLTRPVDGDLPFGFRENAMLPNSWIDNVSKKANDPYVVTNKADRKVHRFTRKRHKWKCLMESVDAKLSWVGPTCSKGSTYQVFMQIIRREQGNNVQVDVYKIT